MAKVTIEEAIRSINPEISEILSRDYRKTLDTRITILDLSKDALKVNVYRNTTAHMNAFDYAYSTLVEVLNAKAKRVYTSLSEIPDNYFDKTNAPFLYINGGDSNRFIVAKSFGAIRDFITTQVSRDPKLLKTSFGQSSLFKEELNKQGIPSGSTTKSSRTKIDIGHIPSENSDNLISPLEMKLSDILSLGRSTNNPIIVAEANKALSDLYSIQANMAYSFKNTAPEAIATAKSKLGELYVVVTLHRQKLNAVFSTKELQIFNRLKANIALKLSKFDISSISGSNTIKEDILENLGNIFKVTGKRLKVHNTRTVKAPTINLKKSISISSETLGIKKPNVPSVQNNIGYGYSLVNLQSLINDSLQNVISANMGNGSSRNTLNYQTGRFAASVNVERMSQSREGMITAFYSYMKNPYQTFEPGYKQGSPKTRDPKLLIAKSIREIAATKVGNRLRAVSV